MKSKEKDRSAGAATYLSAEEILLNYMVNSSREVWNKGQVAELSGQPFIVNETLNPNSRQKHEVCTQNWGSEAVRGDSW